jgi:hypothetical protein
MINLPMRTLFLTLALATLCGCKSLPKPAVSMANAHFAEGPVIIQRGEHYYLRYRIALEQGHFTPVRQIVLAKKTKDAGYYYFGVPISHTEWGNLIEHPLAYDDFEDCAREGKVYWLDRDGTKHLLRIQSDN